MKRRDFVSKVLITRGVLSLRIGCQRKIEPVSEGEQKTEVLLNKTTGKTITEPEKQYPFLLKQMYW